MARPGGSHRRQVRSSSEAAAVLWPTRAPDPTAEGGAGGGRVVAAGTPEEVAADPEFERLGRNDGS